MKRIIFLIMILILWSAAAFAQESGEAEAAFNLVAFLKANWAELIVALMAFIKVVVRLTPSVKDDYVFGKIDSLISWIIPNLGGKSKITNTSESS